MANLITITAGAIARAADVMFNFNELATRIATKPTQTGPWDATRNYVTNDMVQYNSTSYVANRANLNVTPVVGADWSIFAGVVDASTTVKGLVKLSVAPVSSTSPIALGANEKDASGGVPGLTLFKINFRNVLNTFTSFFTNANTAARTYTFQDRNGTIADDTDLATKQPLDSELTALAGLTSAANKVPYFTGSGTAALADFTAAGRALVDDADAIAQRTTLGLGDSATKNVGTAAGTVAAGDDARLSDARTPVAPEAVTAPTLLNSWANSGDGLDAGYYKNAGRVYLQGCISGGAALSVAFTLPSGYRPGGGIVLSGYDPTSGLSPVSIATGGDVTIINASSEVFLDGLSFRLP